MRTTIATKWVSLQGYFTNLNWKNRWDVEWTGGASISLSASCPMLSCEYGWKLVKSSFWSSSSWLDKGRSIWNMWSESLVQWLTWKEVARAVYGEDINNKVKYNLNPLCCRKTNYVGYSIQSILILSCTKQKEFPMKLDKNTWLLQQFWITLFLQIYARFCRSTIEWCPISCMVNLAITWIFIVLVFNIWESNTDHSWLR